jgi:hypothetical protein
MPEEGKHIMNTLLRLPLHLVSALITLLAFPCVVSPQEFNENRTNNSVQSDPGARLVQDYYESRRGTGCEVPDTLDLADNALLAIHAITSGMDPEMENRLWFSIYFDRKPICMRHHEPSEFDQAGKYLEGLALMRLMTGSSLNQDREEALWRFVENHTGPDGLIYYHAGQPSEPPANPYTQARVLLSRICRYELRDDPELRKKIELTIDSMVDHKMTRGFGFGPLLPAIRWYKRTGYPNAMTLAKLDFDALEQAHTFAEDGSFGGHFHYHSGAAIGLLAYGLETKNKALVEKMCRVYEFARSKGTDYGYFPECLPPSPWVMLISNEGCCTADMTSLAAILSRVGAGDYWDDLDRYLRNQLTEMQLKQTGFVDRIPIENQVAIPISPQRGEREVDDLTRFIGAFAGWAAPNDFAGPAHFWLQQCCLGNCPRGLYQGWESIVTPSESGMRVNLLLNRSTPVLDVNSSLPYEGKVEILVKKKTRVQVRLPGWVELNKVSASIDSKTAEITWNGRYLGLPVLYTGANVVISFPINEWTSTYSLPGAPWAAKYSIVDEDSGSGMPLPKSISLTLPDIVKKILTPTIYNAHFRANTLVRIDPQGGIYPLYQRNHMLTSQTPRGKVNRYVPETVVSNWY